MPQRRSSKPWEVKQRKMAQANIDLGINTSAFTAGLNDAGQKAQTFEGRLAGLFRRSPLHRAERAFGDFAANLATGNVAQAVAGLAGRFTGLGLIIGTVVGAGALIFNKFKSQLDATAKAADAVNKELAKPLSLQGGLGLEGITAEIATLDKALDNLAQKRKSLASRIQEAGVRGAPETFDENAFLRGRPQPGIARKTGEEIAQEQGEQRRLALQEKQADAEVKLASIKVQALTSSEKDAALAKIALDLQDKRSKLLLEFQQKGGNFLDQFRRFQAAQVTAKAESDEAERKSALKEKELAIDKDIAEQALRGVSAEDQKVSKLEQELALIQQQLSGAQALTTENRKQLETSQAKTLAELAAARAAASGRPVLSTRDIHERAKLGLEEIAAGGGRQARIPFNLADEIQFGEQAKQLGPAGMARQALRDEALARQAALRGDLGTAEQLFGMSDKLREGIPGLKSAEKPISIADALKEYGKGPEIVTQLETLNGKMDAYFGN